MSIDGLELKDFVKTTVQSIREGLNEVGCTIVGYMQFELGVVTTSQSEGGFKIFVASASDQLSEQFISKIIFDVEPKKKEI